jgi:hypothetical protein
MKTITLAALTAAALVFAIATSYSAAARGNSGGERSSTGGTAAEQGQGGSKVLICHRTRAETNPYVLISVSVSALPAHMRHGDAQPGQSEGPFHPSVCPTETTGSSDTSGASENDSGDADVKGKGKK